ncbi:MAG: IS110 family transposase [Rhodospirillaceae bacterium]|nr:IS110 family transposase [Rhodospirillaceae bacterium]
MENVSIVGIDLAKRSFQLHGAAPDGSVVFRKKLSRPQLLVFLAKLPRCIVAMEACATSHHWGREIGKLGHETRLIPPVYVKPFVKRQKNDANDAEAIAEAASRPTMRYVSVKSAEQQAQGMVFRTRDLFVRQRSQLVNALRGHLAEYGTIIAQGMVQFRRMMVNFDETAPDLPAPVQELCCVYIEQISLLDEKIGVLDKEIQHRAKTDEGTSRLMTIPGVGPMCATTIQAFAPPMEEFANGREFAAWCGLVPRQKSTGGRQILGRTSKMGQRDIRRLLITGAMAVIRWAIRKGPPAGSWLANMLARKPRMLVATALANKLARTVWALTTKKEDYRIPPLAA